LEASQIRNYVEGMEYREFGGTGMVVSRIGYGGIFREQGQSVEEAEVVRCYSEALRSGVNLFDFGYGTEEAFASHFGNRRKDCFLSVKVRAGVRGYERVLSYFEEKLEQLRTDCIDVCRMPGDERFDPEYIRAFRRLREQGKTRALVLYTHRPPDLAERVKTPEVDGILIPYNYVYHGDSEKLALLCKRLRKGVLAMKVAGGSRVSWEEKLSQKWAIQERNPHMWTGDWLALARNEKRKTEPIDAVRWALDQDPITVLLLGMTRQQHVRENVAAAREHHKETAAQTRA